MESAFRALTSGIAFDKLIYKGTTERKRKRETIEKDSSKEILVETNDPIEAANVVRKRLKVKVQGQAVPSPSQDFKEIDETLLEALASDGYDRPTPVQAQVIPLLLQGRDVIAISPTGSGKTLAFLLPMLSSAQARKEGESGVFGVVLVPSRELAQQIQRVSSRLAQSSKLRCVVLTKASATGDDFTQVGLLVATPLRLCRAIKLRNLPLSTTRFLVLDEADKLLQEKEEETSFLKQIDTIVAACQQKNKRLTISIFSATIPEEVERLVRTVQKEVVRVTVGSRNATASSVKQRLQYVGSEEGRFLMLQSLFRTGIDAPVLIFVSSSEAAGILQRKLLADNISVESIFSSQSYESRSKALATFRAGKVWILITTDLLARGIDFIGVKTVINYDCPNSLQDYVHRIGRTGRASQSGSAITFITEKDADLVRPIANLIVEAGQSVPEWMLLKGHQSKPLIQKKKKKQKL